MHLKVRLYMHEIHVDVNGRARIDQLKNFIYGFYGIPVAEQRLYEQAGQDELGDEDVLGDDIYIQDLVDIENRGLKMELKNCDRYMVDLIVRLPNGTELNSRFYSLDKVVRIRKFCLLSLCAFSNSITLRLRVSNKELSDHEYLFQFNNGKVIKCVVNENI